MTRVVEFRTYQLQPGTRPTFHRLFVEDSRPMLLRWGVDVVTHGPSRHGSDGYVLVRAYDDLAARESSQDAFYGSDEWRSGPREPILACLVGYLDTVLDLDEPTIDGLRRTPFPPAEA